MKTGNKRSGFAGLLLILVVVFGGGVTFLLTGCGSDQNAGGQAKSEQLYTCGMHPQVLPDHPGNCPIRGMKLTPIRKASGSSPVATDSSGDRKIKYYKSTITPGEIRQTPGKDSMGMDMVPVY